MSRGSRQQAGDKTPSLVIVNATGPKLWIRSGPILALFALHFVTGPPNLDSEKDQQTTRFKGGMYLVAVFGCGSKRVFLYCLGFGNKVLN